MPELRSGVRQSRLKSRKVEDLDVQDPAENLPVAAPTVAGRRGRGRGGRGGGRGRGRAGGRGRGVPVIDLDPDQPFEVLPGAGVGGGAVGGPQHRLELAVPAPAAGLELLLEGPGLKASQDLCVGAFGLAIAPGVRHRSVADLRSKVSTIYHEEIASELRAVVGDDAIRDPKPVHETLYELDRRSGRDGVAVVESESIAAALEE